MRHRTWGMLMLVPALAFVAVRLTAPYANFFQHLYLSGTPDRFAATVVRAGRSDARASLWIDNLFVLSWILVVPRLLRAGLQRWAPERRRMFGRWRVAPAIALWAGATDLAENGFALALVGKSQPPTGLILTITTLAWIKWLLYVWALAAVVALVVGPLVAPVVRPVLRRLFGGLDRFAGSHPPRPEPVDVGAPQFSAAEPVGERIGICVSGGGIRAASVALGALRRLDAARPNGGSEPSIFLRSSWLVAVSGGAYTAAGWRISRRPGNRVEPIASAVRDGLFDADHRWANTVRTRRRFLDNGGLSIVGGVLNVVVRTLFVLGAMGSALYLLGRLAGRAVRTRAVHPWFPYADLGREQLLGWREFVPMRLVVPGAVLVGAAVLLALAAYSLSRVETRAFLLRPALVAGLAGVGLLIAVVGVPAGLVYGRRLLSNVGVGGGPVRGAGLLGALSSLGVVAAVAGVIIAQVKRRWLNLGGVLLVVIAVLFAGKVADTFAYGYGGLWDHLALAVIAVAWLVSFDCVASHRLTLGGMYRKRLAATFAAADDPVAGSASASSLPLAPLAYSDEPSWADYIDADGPELIIAATAHTSYPTFCGLPAYGFSFRPGLVTLHDRTDGSPAQVAMATYPRGSWWDGFPRGWIISRSMALTGAAFASAMGRQALGTTNAMLVAFNLRLGAWVPNPRFVHWFADPMTAPRVHIGYFLKELFNRYHPNRDAFVYVADGGHRENLGLVELLRERPSSVFCVDASGESRRSSPTGLPTEFRALNEAIELARVELDIDIDIDLSPLTVPPNATVPLDCAVEGVIRYGPAMGGGTARLLYGRSQLSEAALPELQRYGAIDDRFPNYSTLDQYLTDVEHLQLVALGEHVGDRMVGLFNRS